VFFDEILGQTSILWLRMLQYPIVCPLGQQICPDYISILLLPAVSWFLLPWQPASTPDSAQYWPSSRSSITNDRLLSYLPKRLFEALKDWQLRRFPWREVGLVSVRCLLTRGRPDSQGYNLSAVTIGWPMSPMARQCPTCRDGWLSWTVEAIRGMR
jgi:hypothetical protein